MRTKDHVVPKSKGGRKTVEACIKCNAAKKDMSLEEFRALRGGVEFYGEMIPRQEQEKTDWIYEFNAEHHTVSPVPNRKSVAPIPAPLPVYEATVDLSKVKQYPARGRTKKDDLRPNTLPYLEGTKFGAFTVIRWVTEGGRWEVVCLCGAKELRTTKAIRNPANTFDACMECRKPLGKLKSELYKETGVEVSWEECFERIYGSRDRTQDANIIPNAGLDPCIQSR